MLTNQQLALIDKIPAEGALDYEFDGRTMRFEQADIDAVVDQFFAGKIPPAVKEARIMMGAPGAGKTRLAQQLYRSSSQQGSTIFIGYNEGGAEEHFEPFQDEMRTASTLDERLRVAKKYQPVTQRIQNQTLKRALREGYSVLVDITAAGPGAKHMMNTLRALDYQTIDMVAVHAPFAMSAERALDRQRPADPIADVVGKRSGVLAWMHRHAVMADSFRLYYNPSNEAEPRLCLDCEGQNITQITNADDVFKAMSADLGTEMPAVQAYLQNHCPDDNTRQALIAAHKDACEKMDLFLRSADTPKQDWHLASTPHFASFQ